MNAYIMFRLRLDGGPCFKECGGWEGALPPPVWIEQVGPSSMRDLDNWQTLAARTVVEYAMQTCGRAELPVLLAGFERYDSWARLIPAVFGIPAEKFENGWHNYVKTHYVGSFPSRQSTFNQPERNGSMRLASGSKRCRQIQPLSLPNKCKDTDVMAEIVRTRWISFSGNNS